MDMIQKALKVWLKSVMVPNTPTQSITLFIKPLLLLISCTNQKEKHYVKKIHVKYRKLAQQLHQDCLMYLSATADARLLFSERIVCEERYPNSLPLKLKCSMILVLTKKLFIRWHASSQVIPSRKAKVHSFARARLRRVKKKDQPIGTKEPSKRSRLVKLSKRWHVATARALALLLQHHDLLTGCFGEGELLSR